MLIFIKTLTGKTISVDVQPTDLVAAIKEKITAREGVPAPFQRLLVDGKELADDKTLEDCGIQQEAIIHLVLRKSEENMKQLTSFEKSELKEAQSAKLSQFYNASAGLNNELAKFKDSESKFDKHQNPSCAAFDLGKDGEFKDFTVLIGQHYPFDLTAAKKALNKKGFNIIHTTTEKDFLDNLDKADVAWIISSDNARSMPADYVPRVIKYHRSLGGLMIFGDNAPFYAHANALLAQMFKNTVCSGDDPGHKTMQIGDPNKAGCFGTHLITSGIISLFEGITICSTNSKATPLKTLGTNSSGRPAIQFADHEILPDENCGRVVLDHGFTKLYSNWDDAGTARYVSNATVWLLALEHRTSIGVPITARRNTKDPTKKETFFRIEGIEFSAGSVAELIDKLPRKMIKESSATVSFRLVGDLSERLKESKCAGEKLEWSKSQPTDQRRPVAELEEWIIEKKSGHFYLYF